MTSQIAPNDQSNCSPGVLNFRLRLPLDSEDGFRTGCRNVSHNQPDDLFQSRYVTPELKPFSSLCVLHFNICRLKKGKKNKKGKKTQ